MVEHSTMGLKILEAHTAEGDRKKPIAATKSFIVQGESRCGV
jgi:hypothetical protein